MCSGGGKTGSFRNESAQLPVVFSAEALSKGLRAIWEEQIDVRTEIERNIFEETLRLFNEATSQGLAESYDPALITDRFLQELRTNNAVFSAFRTHRMQNDIAAQLIDPLTGQLKSFDRWKLDIKGMTDHYCHAWLQTEYDTAVIRAHQAADWKHFLEEADVLPNIRWMPTTSITPDPLHQHYWEKKLTLPVNHPFWQEHRPGDRWNCKCSLQQTDDPVNASALDGWTPPLPQPGLEGNPGISGRIFSDNHPYYTEAYPGARDAVMSFLGVESAMIPAETIADAEQFATRFVKQIGLDRTFKGQVSYKGIDVAVANRINSALVQAYSRLDMPQISGIKAIRGTSAAGKRIFKSLDTVAAYDPVQKGIYLNSDILSSMDKFDAYVTKSREAFEIVKRNLDKLPPDKRALAERYIKAGRELVDDSLEGMILHELGHHAQWTLVPTKMINELGEWEKIAARISGYAGTNKSEYLAESFVSWMREEKRIDAKLQALFDGRLKDIPVAANFVGGGGKKPSFVRPQSQKLRRSAEGIAAEMERLRALEGEAYWKQLKAITERREFKRVGKGIFSAAGKTDSDYDKLISAAKKATEHGFRAFILPNPNNAKSADLILERKGFYRMYEVKSPTGKTSVSNRLFESESQANSVILNVSSTLNPRLLADAIKDHFESSPRANEVLVFKGKKMITISRNEALKGPSFIRDFWKQYK